ncbi:MAG: InlB B-repeat-containing protein, partial [Clostridia bacterium]|nr:InlB B-repeat-containing protein [Clostridia bacterium]
STFTTMPARNVDVHGTYTANEYNLKYYVDGELYQTQVYHYQDAIVPLENPEKAGYDFSGWSYIPAKMPARDYNVNGSFTAKQISYFYMIDNKIKYTFRGTVGTPVIVPEVNVPENYEFSGWSPEVPEVMGTESMMFRGSLIKVKSFIEFDLNGGTGNVPEKAAYTIGSSITLPSDVSRTGYVFGGWSASSTSTTGVFTYEVTAEDVLLYAVWTDVPAAIEPADNSDTVVDAVYKLISGLCERITAAVFESDYIEVTGRNADVTIEQGIGFGTGSKAILTQNGSTVATYEIVIYGDVDGDGIADGRDVQIAQLLAEGLLTKANVGAAVYEAADFDHDGEITENDVQLIVESGIFTQTIDQTK